MMVASMSRALLADVADIVMGQSPPSDSYNGHAVGMPFLQGKAEFGTISPRPVKWCSDPKKTAEPGSVLLSVRAPVGDVNLADQRYCIGRGLAALMPKPNLDGPYLFFYLQTLQSWFNSQSSGSTFQSINAGVLRNLVLDLPPLAEQRRIARILSAIQSAAEAVRTGTVCRRSVADSLADTVFAPYLDRTWKTHSLGDVTNQRQYGLSIKGGAAGSLPILRMTNLSRGVVTYENLQYVDMPTADAEGYVLRPGDILFNRTNSPDLVGRVGIVERSIPSVFASYLIRVVCDEQVVLPEFLNAFLNWAPIQARLRGMATRGVSQANISASTLATVEVPVPALDAQLDVIRAWRAAQRAIEASLVEGEALTRVFKSAQAALFAGAA